MTRIPRRFDERPASECEWLLTNTWCERCGEADLGMLAPIEYEENGIVFLEGRCKVCDAAIRSEVRETKLKADE